MKKRMLSLILTAVMVISLLAGCQPSATTETEASTKAPENQTPTTQAPADDKTEAPTEVDDKEWFGTEDGKTITLRFWAGIQPEYGYADMVENFNAEYADKGLQVEYVKYVNNTDGNLLHTCDTGTGSKKIVLTSTNEAYILSVNQVRFLDLANPVSTADNAINKTEE